MTLHWWMHWFWVTLWFTAITGTPLPRKNGDTTDTATTISASTTEGSLISTVKSEQDKFGHVKTTRRSFNESSSKYISEESLNTDSLFHVKSDIDGDSSPSSFPQSPIILPSSSSLSLKQNSRVAKAIGTNQTFSPPPTVEGIERELTNENVNFQIRDNEDSTTTAPTTTNIIKNRDLRVDRETDDNDNDKKDKSSVLKLVVNSDDHPSSGNRTHDNSNPNNKNNNRTSISAFNNDKASSLPLIRKDSKVTWIATGNNNNSNNNDDNNNNNNTSRNEKLINNNDGHGRNSSNNYNDDGHLAVLPLQEPIPTRFKLVLNRTKFIPSININDDDDDNDNNRLFNKSHDVEIRGDVIEPRLLATAASILQGVSESPRLSRARSAFPGDYQQDEQQDRKKDKSSENNFNNATNSAIDIAAVTGSCLASLILIGTMGSLGFIMYRRRYLNPPQSLNSDKCSNPDSSGYIDDSTIRDNSEEMYSLDNDSFLNSLEAMTIQNYWTDSVKHTKL